MLDWKKWENKISWEIDGETVETLSDFILGRGAWQATVHGGAKNRTQLSD